MREIYASLPPYSALAIEIEKAISSSGNLPEGAKNLRDSFIQENIARKSHIRAALQENGFSEEDAKYFSQIFSKERAMGYRKVDSTVFISKKIIQDLVGAKSISEIEDALAGAVKGCDRWREEHGKLSSGELSGCPEPPQTCAMNARTIQHVVDLSAKAQGISPPKIEEKIRSLLKEKENRTDLRESWNRLTSSAALRTLSGELGRISLFSFLEEAKIIPGNITSVMAHGLLEDPQKRETLRRIRAQIDQVGLVLRNLAKDGENPALFDLVSKVGESFATCESLYDDGGSRIPFLLRLEIFHAVLGFEKELRECALSAQNTGAEAKALARSLELEALKSLGLEKLARSEMELLSSSWESLSPELKTKLTRILESRARYEGQVAITEHFREPRDLGSEHYTRAVQKITSIYLAEDSLWKASQPAEIPNDQKKPELPSSAGDPDLRFWPSSETLRTPPRGIRILNITVTGEKAATATVEFILPNGKKRVTTTELKAVFGAFYLMAAP